jgi:hypothetical protein
MAKEWYEEDDNESVWWKASKKNAHAACNVKFQDYTGFSENNWWVEGFAYGTILNYMRKAGFKKTVGNFALSASKKQWATSLSWVAHSYCIGALVGGMIDAKYQVHHDGRHMLSDKWDFDVQAVTNLLMTGYGKYKNDSHQVELLLRHVDEWWRA